jgi:hypothetical protein
MKSSDNDEDAFNMVISEPHDKGVLTTKLGRKIENVTFEDLLVLALLALIISSEYFYIFTPLGHGLNSGKETWSTYLALDSIYFSFVTFTTLGYGDLSPIGFGRAVAVALVLFGLVIVALTIGKIASERQQSMLLLLHTSDCQRRIAGFIDNLDNYLQDIQKSSKCSRYVKVEKVKATLNDLKYLIEAIENYIAFHLYQSKMIDFGNNTAVSMLLQKNEEITDALIMLFKSDIADKVVCARALGISKKLAKFEALILTFQHQKNLSWKEGPVWRNSFIGLRERMGLAEKAEQTIRIEDGNSKIKYNKFCAIAKSEPSEWVFDQVEKLLPPPPRTHWPRHQHKRIASELGISNKLAEKCIRTLIQRGAC